MIFTEAERLEEETAQLLIDTLADALLLLRMGDDIDIPPARVGKHVQIMSDALSRDWRMATTGERRDYVKDIHDQIQEEMKRLGRQR